MSAQTLLIAEALLLGLVFGSFLNVCIHRIPKGATLGGRSACPHCKKKIVWHDNIPVISFLLLGGRCRSCRRLISFQYPLVEILTAALSVATLLRVNYQAIPYAGWFFLFMAPLVVISFIDMHHRIIPDVITLPGIPAGLLFGFFSPDPLGLIGPDVGWWPPLLARLVGALIGGGLLLILGQLYFWIKKREGMGGGDIKLAAMLGIFLGWQGIIFVFFLSSIFAILYAVFSMIVTGSRKKSAIIPYGPFLSAAAILIFLYGSEIWSFYMGLIHR